MLDDFQINPQAVCCEAAGIIRSLAQAYAAAFNLERMPLLASCILSAIEAET